MAVRSKEHKWGGSVLRVLVMSSSDCVRVLKGDNGRVSAGHVRHVSFTIESRVELVSCRVRERTRKPLLWQLSLILRRLSAHKHNNGQLVHLPLLGGYTACMDMDDVIVVSLSEWRIGRRAMRRGGWW